MEITKGENANLAGMEPRCPKCENEKLHIGQGDGRFWVTCTNGHATEVPLDFEISHFAQFFRSPVPTPPLDVEAEAASPAPQLKLKIQELVGLPVDREIEDDLVFSAVKALHHAVGLCQHSHWGVSVTHWPPLPAPPQSGKEGQS